MSVHKMIIKTRWIFWCLLLVAVTLVLTSCDEPAGLHVSKASLERPDWVVPPPGYQYKVVVTISFNRAVDPDSFKAPGTVKIGLKGMRDGRAVSDISGEGFQFSADSKTAVFISEATLGELINPGAGENIEYSITVLGTDTGDGVVTDAAGVALDGDRDGQPGGDYHKTIEVVG
jgi:hypothetical protein